MTIIDAHHHFWKYDPVEYGWIDETMKVIRRDFLPEDLRKTLTASGVDRAVSVQARQSLEETEWLVSLAERHDFLAGVVGWVPLIDAKVAGTLEKLAAHPKLKAIRHILQGEADDNYMLRADFQAGIATLKRFGLVYDILIYERHLPQAIQFVDRNPSQVFILDHIAKPRIRDGVISSWRENMIELARRPNVYCKLSGVVTEADYKAWTVAEIRPYIDVVLGSFGPRRVMFGSDWPVMLVAAPYGKWLDIVKAEIASLSRAEQDRILGGTAREAYKL